MNLQQALDAWTKTIPTTHVHVAGTFRPTTIIDPSDITGTNRVKNTTGVKYFIPAHYDGDCPCISGSQYHWKQTTEKRMIGKESVSVLKFVQRDDSEVCDRERAWRHYISIRDGKSYHVGEPKKTYIETRLN